MSGAQDSPPSLETEARPERAILASVVTRGPVEPDHFAELDGLCRTVGIEPVGSLTQLRQKPSVSHYFGKGKLVELVELAATLEAELVVCDEELSPTQARNLEKKLEIRVLDRSELIISIFAAHARSKQARLQVELAQRNYEFPRLRGLWTHLDRERGGIGLRSGMGEKQIDIDRRLLKKRIRRLRLELEAIEARKHREISSRQNVFQCSIVGYTNAGKSTLMNRLTDAGVEEADRLFATLDTRTRRWELGEGRGVLLSDTVGFIRSIPHDLVASFHATLAEAIEADLLLVVVDSADPHAIERLETVLEVLEEIGAGGKQWVPVLNKTDALTDRDELVLVKTRWPEAVEVSARTGEGIDALRAAVLERLDQLAREVWLEVPHEKSALHAQVRELTTVADVRYEAKAALFRVFASPAALMTLEARGVRVAPEAEG